MVRHYQFACFPPIVACYGSFSGVDPCIGRSKMSEVDKGGFDGQPQMVVGDLRWRLIEWVGVYFFLFR